MTKPMPTRITVVGDLERGDHFHLTQDATCYFWGEYTPAKHLAGPPWEYSETNHLILNFKKKLDRKGHADWRYKIEAINKAATGFARLWKWNVLHEQHRVALIPIPPSKARTDPMFDPRMLDMLTAVASQAGLPLDIRDCLSFSGAYAASHDTDDRPSPDQLFSELTFDPVNGKSDSQPGLIFLFDDLLTTGAHYVAVSRKLNEHFPGVKVVGNFIARRCFPNPFL